MLSDRIAPRDCKPWGFSLSRVITQLDLSNYMEDNGYTMRDQRIQAWETVFRVIIITSLLVAMGLIE
jgi:hypothetical protein